MSKIIGRKPVLEALQSEVQIEQIYITKDAKGDIIHKIFSFAKKERIKISEVPYQKIDSISERKNSQGIVAITSGIKYSSVDEIISHSKKSTYPLILILDTIHDPHNVGAILRTAECAGVDGVLVTTHNSSPLNETVEKVSAGAVNHLKIAKINNLVNSIKILKEENFWIVGSHLDKSSKDYTELDYKMPVALIVGNEEKGIRKLTAENCDFLVHIPMKGKMQSLNVSVAAGVLLFEIFRNRNI
ncbi:MAG: 23S rRNA (guanosine(2251)-2'-O)-methyltransferase RlmB [Ignavibacteria bacterium]|jgi:23S rRNA (guanosine2251-2'-O)-methyltransferase